MRRARPSGSGRRARAGHLAEEVFTRLRLDVAGNLPAAFDLDLAVADRAGDPAGGADQEALADDQIAFEAAAHLDVVDCRRPLEQPRFGDLDIVAVLQIGLDAA